MARPPEQTVALLESAYRAFNARDIEQVLRHLAPDVAWANGMEGGHVHGHGAVRDYWTRQFSVIRPAVEPLVFDEESGGRVAVTVHQVVSDMNGAVLADREVRHVYQLRDGLITRMDIEEPIG